MRLAPLTATRSIVDDDGRMTAEMRKVMNALVKLTILEGSGSPEGVVEAEARRLYMDLVGTSGNILYIKQSDSVGGDKSNGWILI